MMARKDRTYSLGEDLRFGRAKRPAGRFFLTALEVVLLSLCVSCILYIGFALVVNTDTEARLKRENKMYSKLYPELLSQEELLENAVTMLESKDNSIYGEVFSASAPSVNPIGSIADVHSSDTIPDAGLVGYAYDKSVQLARRAARVDDNFVRILLQTARPGRTFPPMAMPLHRVSYAQVGASVGSKLNPVYNAHVDHDGVDFIVHQGKNVYATADGVVTSVEKSAQGRGNTIVIMHPGGYETSYSHLASMYVSRGQRVTKGQKIGNVGSSGNTSAPHLHYSLRLGSAVLDPIAYMYAGVNPETYANFLYMGTKTEKSLD